VSSIGVAAERLCEELAAFDPLVHSGGDCAALVEQFARTENALRAGRARAAVRAGECGAHRSRGFADPSDWVANASGSTIRSARAELETVDAVATLPATSDAWAAGEVSLAQAAEIARTEAEVPGCEAELLAIAREGSLGAVRDRARKCRVAAIDPDALYAKQQERREGIHWRDELGMVWLRVGLAPDVGMPIVTRLEAETDRVWREAHRQGRIESRAACRADAFVRLLDEAGSNTATRAGRSRDLVLVCDLDAYRRGAAKPGEVSCIAGGGPVPVSVVRELAEDAFLKVAFRVGVDITRVAHLGRRFPAELRTALELGTPPEFDGLTCSAEGCDRRYGLEWDHIDPVAHGGASSAANLQPLCALHHREKTQRDRAAGRLGSADNEDRAPP
jgi:hypothetical protein